MPMSDDKKLTLLYRVEPGCLGPKGVEYIEDFCSYANKQLCAPEFAVYRFVARYDKNMPELQYSVAERNLSTIQAETYLNHFNTNKSQFEEQLDELLTQAIDNFFDR